LTQSPGIRLRFCIAACLVVVPFLNFVARNEYGYFHPEIGVAVLLLAVVSGLFAVAARGPGFPLLTVALVVVTGTAPLARSVPGLPEWSVAVALGAATGGLLWFMRLRFYYVLAVFVLSGLLLEVAGHLPLSGPGRRPAARPVAGHVLWIVLDEQIGLDGFPECAECVRARARLAETLRGGNFEIYPRAYSNYASTIESIPSIANGRLLAYPGERIEQIGQGGMRYYRFRSNRLVADYAARGYRVIGYQHASILSCEASFGAAECRNYNDRLGRLLRAPGAWTDRFRWLVANYQRSDPWIRSVRGFFPFKFGLAITGPLGISDFWPDGLARDILAEPQRAFFFIHLLTPHAPYLYRRDGSMRPLSEWTRDRADQRVSSVEYAARYRRYCEQVEFAATELGRFLARLRAGGILDSTTIVLHGDHGSRIRRPYGAMPDGAAVEEDAEDLPAALDARDLVDRFSTLLAIHRPGATAASVLPERHSVLTLLSRHFFHVEPAEGAARADLVYLKDRQFRYCPVDIQSLWR
jgi:hypothetical protein